MSIRLHRRLSLSTIRRQVVGINQKVPIYNGQRIPYVNFDNAASTPTLKPVLESILDFLPWYSGVHRGSGYKSVISTATYDAARIQIAQFFGADPDYHVVIFGKNTTEAINLLADRLQFEPGDMVLTTLMEHHSNDLPWRRVAKVVRAEVDAKGALDEQDLEKKLTLYHRRIKLVAISGASNVTGWINDIHRIAALAHNYGIPIMVDGAQLAPHRAINLLPPSDPAHVDFLAISGHKLYAPFGTGVLIGPRPVFERGSPRYVGGGTVSLVTPLGVEWATPPAKDEAGSPNVIGVIALATALTVLEELGLDKIEHHEQSLIDYALGKFGRIPGLKIYGSTQPQDVNRLGVMSFELEGYHHVLVAGLLAFYGGIGVRSGCFCAQPYIQRLLGLDGTALARLRHDLYTGKARHLPGLVRISFGMYNSPEELDRLVEALQVILSYSPRYWQEQLVWDDSLECYIPRDKRFTLGIEPIS
ncbi:MAG: aminotransferase class V-fold PLP-dependent enzyme [Firmicutes bacterium]|jgi:cysteine desulfurase/selenocysteine lyase|nr:aminotransferase class V-fold PLP-dependent enzyme [Bacillota bacterium]